ncbi:hypothetical protein [Actinoplanes sp. HUAS TT8]|uniref:hypothetical protein n=1 Tax=Actinoplanes sp. HUAS TT8 TaxID=3447453 RepID=UPI003F51B9D9
MDWNDDDSLTSRIDGIDRWQRFAVAFLAIRRLHAPLLEFDFPEDWGFDRSWFEALVRPPRDFGSAEWADEFNGLVEEESAAPLWEDEIEPTVVEEIQLDAVMAIDLLHEAWEGLEAEQIRAIVEIPRKVGNYMDEIIELSAEADPAEGDRQSYLGMAGEDLVGYGLGYFGRRNLEIEYRCHDAVGMTSARELFAAPEGQELLALCDDFSREVVAALRLHASS